MSTGHFTIYCVNRRVNETRLTHTLPRVPACTRADIDVRLVKEELAVSVAAGSIVDECNLFQERFMFLGIRMV